MRKKLKNNLVFILTLIFLVVAFLSSTFWNGDFTLTDLFNTDGLAALGILLAFFAQVTYKIPLIKRFLYFVLLKLNFKNIDYKIILKLDFDDEITIEDLIKDFHEIYNESKIYNSDNFDVKISDDLKYSINHKSMASLLEISYDAMNEMDQDLNRWTFKLESVNKFSVLERNLKFMMQYFLSKLGKRKSIEISSLSLELTSKTTEFDISNDFDLVDHNKHPLEQASAIIKISDSTKVSIDKNAGIMLNSNDQTDMLTGYDIVKSILIG